MNDPMLLTVKQVAALTNLGESHVWRLIYAQSLPSVRIGRSVRIRRCDLDAFIGERLERAS